jgi:hypothetical protein
LRGRERVVTALVLEPRGAPDHLPSRLDLRGHVRDDEGDALERADRPPELLAFLDVRDGRIERRLGQTDRQGADADAPAVEDREEHLEPVATLAEHVCGRYAAILEDAAHP